MGTRLSLATVKKIVLAISAVIVAVVYYFISYFFCYFLINVGLISASDPSDNFQNPLAIKIVAVTSGDKDKPVIAVATSSDWKDNFAVVNQIASVISSSSAPVPGTIPYPKDQTTLGTTAAVMPETPPTSAPAASIPAQDSAALPTDTAAVNPTATVPTTHVAQIFKPDTTSVATGSPASVVTVQPEIAPNIVDSSLLFGSYFDTFSNNKYVDSSQTALYYDEAAAAYFFPPDYVFLEIGDGIDMANRALLDNIRLNNFEGPYGDKRCLDNHCLEQKGNELFFDGNKLSQPGELSGLNIAAVSIGSLTRRWLVGFTIKTGSGYEGIAYYFDGQNFSRILTPDPIVSPYFGLLGFGGGENDFLLIYGAYKSIAYHVQGDNIFNISRFFDSRVMNGGFKPEVLFTAFESNINWYVYSTTSYHPALIKLWQNRGSEIVGGMVLDSLFQRYDESAVFRLSRAENGAITLLAKLKRNGRDYWFNFVDKGFKNENGGALVSLPIAHDGYASLVTIVKIAKSSLGVDALSADKAEFLFSADSQQWTKLGNQQEIDISVPATRYFLLKVVLPKLSDKFYSPFISDILFNYYCRK